MTDVESAKATFTAVIINVIDIFVPHYISRPSIYPEWIPKRLKSSSSRKYNLF